MDDIFAQNKQTCRVIKLATYGFALSGQVSALAIEVDNGSRLAFVWRCLVEEVPWYVFGHWHLAVGCWRERLRG